MRERTAAATVSTLPVSELFDMRARPSSAKSMASLLTRYPSRPECNDFAGGDRIALRDPFLAAKSLKRNKVSHNVREMKWEAVNAVAQLVSSFGVVASLWYLAVQVHRSTRLAKLAAQDAAASALREVTKPFSENVEVGRLWRTGLEDIETLSADDRARFYHVAFQFLKAMETIHFHYIYGHMDEQIWRGWWNLYRHYLACPGLEHYWRLRSDLFSERFRTFVESLDRPEPRLTVGNLLGQESSIAHPQ